MGELKLIVDSREFGSFAGFKHTDSKYEKNNERLNEYIKLYSSNSDIAYLQIECGENLPMHTIAYICERVKEIKMKVLDVIESRVTNDASLEELQHITYALNNIDEDKNFFAKTFAGISSLGFNGSSPKIPEANTVETK